MEKDSGDMVPGHLFLQNSSVLHLGFFFLYLLNTLDISGEILFQKRDMGLKDQV